MATVAVNYSIDYYYPIIAIMSLIMAIVLKVVICLNSVFEDNALVTKEIVLFLVSVLMCLGNYTSYHLPETILIMIFIILFSIVSLVIIVVNTIKLKRLN